MLIDIESGESTLVSQSTYSDKFVSKILMMINLFSIVV